MRSNKRDENKKIDTRKIQASYNLLIISKEKESYQKKNMLNKKVYRDYAAVSI